MTEYCPNGDLKRYLKKRSGLLNESVILDIFVQVCEGLGYLHQKRILHRDIKTANIFFDEDFKVRIGDFGIAKVLGQKTRFAQSMIGTPYYISPEMLNGEPYDHKNDVWALGCLLYEMCKKRQPFKSEKEINLNKKIKIGRLRFLSQSN